MWSVKLFGCCLLGVSVVGCSTPPASEPLSSYCLEVITDPESIHEYLQFESVSYDDSWVPREKDVQGLRHSLQQYLQNNHETASNVWLDRDFILFHIDEYCIEYSGFIENGTRYIIANMMLDMECQTWLRDNRFTTVYDGGCWFVCVIFFHADDHSVTSMKCHPEA